MHDNSVLITGIGLVSSMGEGADAHWAALAAPKQPNLDAERFAPYTVHALGDIEWNTQIPKRSDQRQMETWQRLGTYAAGLALDDAGIKGDEQLTASMDMIVAAGGGERDVTVDTQILAKARSTTERGTMLNQMLSTELRPTLFLAQLSNLLAGNISIVHKVTGSSRTFMGEEGSGLSAVETAVARIRTGQSSHILVGASYNAEHYDMLLGHELGGYLKPDGWSPIWSRESSQGGGLVTGSGGVFLVLESRKHAKARGGRAYAEIQSVITDQTNRSHKPLTDTLSAMLNRLEQHEGQFTISGASGVHMITAEEKAVLEGAGLIYRGFSSLFGHMREAQFPFALALAALAVEKGQAFAPFDSNEPEKTGLIDSALAVTAGICRAEGMARIIKA